MKEFYLQSTEEVLRDLKVSAQAGLGDGEVIRRQQKFGLNEIPSDNEWKLVRLFFERFRDPLVLILLTAAVISLLSRHTGDAVIIAVALLLDVALSFIQVVRTERTLERLRAQVPETVSVIRGGVSQLVPVFSLVLGDIIEIRAGKRVPADARVISAQGLFTQDAVLTGEARDIPKTPRRLPSKVGISGQHNMLFSGTTVVAGSGVAAVTATGLSTQFGKIAQMLQVEKSPSSPLRRKLQRQGMLTAWVIAAAVLLLSFVGLLQGRPLVETARLAITLVVSAIPEDLTVILTIALTVGVTRILRHSGVVRDLSSAETLGAATVVCCDKTGTLTEGKMRAVGLNFLQGDVLLPEEEVGKDTWQRMSLTGFILASAAYRRQGTDGEFFGSATERAALTFAESCGMSVEEVRKTWRVADEIAFDPKWKYRAVLTIHPTQAQRMVFVTGAPEVLLEHSSSALNEQKEIVPLTAPRRARFRRAFDEMASKEARLLAVAMRRSLNLEKVTHGDVHDLVFLGVLMIQDPVRGEVAAAIRETQAAGVDVKLVTGDLSATAVAVARHVGLAVPEDAVLTGELMHEMDDRELAMRLPSVRVFSRVEPLDKQRIIRLLQARNEVVAMTGDGVNDAVALKAADIGVAMGSGTDIAKDSSDLILLDNSFATITAAIREGRVIRDNVRRVILFLLSTNAAEVAIFLGSLLLGLPLPLLPAQILWINLVTDGTSDIALSLERAERDVMRRRPEDPRAPLISKTLYAHLAFSGFVLTAATLVLYWYFLRRLEAALPYAQTMAFSFLAVGSLLSVWSFRSLSDSIAKRGLTQNIFVPLSAAGSFGLHLLAIYVPSFQRFFGTVPLSARDWMMIGGLGIITTFLIDARKWVLPISKS